MKIKDKVYWAVMLRYKGNGCVMPWCATSQLDTCVAPAEILLYTSKIRATRALTHMPRKTLEACVGRIGHEIPVATWVAHVDRLAQEGLALRGAAVEAPPGVLAASWPVLLNAYDGSGDGHAMIVYDVLESLRLHGAAFGQVISEDRLFGKS